MRSVAPPSGVQTSPAGENPGFIWHYRDLVPQFPHTVKQQLSGAAAGSAQEPATQLRRTGRSRTAAAVLQTPAGNGVGAFTSGAHGHGHCPHEKKGADVEQLRPSKNPSRLAGPLAADSL